MDAELGSCQGMASGTGTLGLGLVAGSLKVVRGWSGWRVGLHLRDDDGEAWMKLLL